MLTVGSVGTSGRRRRWFAEQPTPPPGTIETVNATPETAHRPGQPRSEHDSAFLEHFDARMRLPIIVSAILPLIVVPESGDWLGVVVGIITWLVFLADFVVQARHRERYARTRLGTELSRAAAAGGP